MTRVTATVEPGGGAPGEVLVTMRITSTSAEPVAVPDPDMGIPAQGSGWPYSIEAYRACLLISFGLLAVTVHDAAGEPVAPEPLSTWSTPLRRPDIVLMPGASLDVPIPLGPLFELTAGESYRVEVEYGGARAEGGFTA